MSHDLLPNNVLLDDNGFRICTRVLVVISHQQARDVANKITQTCLMLLSGDDRVPVELESTV